MIFKDYNGQDFSLSEIVELLNNKNEYQIFVGTDSQVFYKKKCVRYATCIILYRKGLGGRIFVSKELLPMSDTLKQRLMNETWRSLNVSFELSKLAPFVEIVIHVDVNKSFRHKSGNYHHELVSLVTGQGYKCYIKPDAWAAQTAADRFTKQ